jgi:hydrogenase maturation protein HypF
MIAERIRVTGIVQGVGFRPTVWRLAHECGLAGQVWNDAEGVLIQAWASAGQLDEFVRRLRQEQPPLARIESILRAPLTDVSDVPGAFTIQPSLEGEVRTGVAADAATCPECLAEVMGADDRRYRYPFTNCTHCGPRLSIVRAIPYDRANTSMASFPMCPRCQAEYEDPADRRFHAQPNACAECGPQVWLENAEGRRVASDQGCDAIETAARLIRAGRIVAIKGIGGIHLACDASNAEVVDTLRLRKHRYQKALALMARDVDMVGRFARVGKTELRLLTDSTAPVVVVDAEGETLAPGVAPGQRTLGFMLPYTPLHHLLMQNMRHPVVLTSGNRSDEPQTIDNQDARRRLGRIADYYLLHDRDIVNRLDDSVLRVADDKPRILRRARGYAPTPLLLPADFSTGRSILAMGSELKNTFCLLKEGKAVVSQHMGDLEDAPTFDDYQNNLQLYQQLYDFTPDLIVVDMHPNYLSTRLGEQLAADTGTRLIKVQHHHAHITSCMAEHGMAMDCSRVLGVALDGLGYAEGGEIWGGEFLLADYRDFERVGHFQPVAMPGGAQAMREPWRNTYAQLSACLGWENVSSGYKDLDTVRYLTAKPLDVMQKMIDRGLNSPKASSAGRLFDAVAAALGVCRDAAAYEGQAAIELESLASSCFAAQWGSVYGFRWEDGVLYWQPLWEALLADVRTGVAIEVIAARFHHTLAAAIAHATGGLCRQHGVDTVVLNGGVLQNRLLLESIGALLRHRGLIVLAPSLLPANDGGLAFGQAVIGAANADGKQNRLPLRVDRDITMS